MMDVKYLSLVIITFFVCSFTKVQAEERVDDTTAKVVFTNQEMLDSVFERLYQLENSRAWKINIVHVGDSHIQADFLTDVIRKSLQSQFGDGGYGFTFPYILAKTNGTRSVKYTSTTNWKGRLNVSPISSAMKIGLSGIGLSTDDSNFKIQINTIKELPFNSIKVLYSTEESQYQISLTDIPITQVVEQKNKEKGYTIHRIRRGETLSVIAANYKTTINAIKEENKLPSSDNIQAGSTLRMPNSGKVKTTTRSVPVRKRDYVDLQSYPYYSSFISPEPLNNISVYSRGNIRSHDINGFVLENDKPGLIYHCIGVNGAKLSDYIKYPLFFRQLAILKPDLVVLSFGTNESYQKLSTEQYVQKVQEMISKIRSEYPGSIVLVMTPPPSLVRRRTENTLVGDYSTALMQLENVPVWDLYTKMGGTKGILDGGKYASIIARDKIHYTIKGYQAQGEMFAEDFLEAYKQFKERRID